MLGEPSVCWLQGMPSVGPLPNLPLGNWIDSLSGPSGDMVTAPRGRCSGAKTRLSGHLGRCRESLAKSRQRESGFLSAGFE